MNVYVYLIANICMFTDLYIYVYVYIFIDVYVHIIFSFVLPYYFYVIIVEKDVKEGSCDKQIRKVGRPKSLCKPNYKGKQDDDTTELPPFISPVVAFTSNPISCACKRSKCIKLYCDCFRFSKFCEGCSCLDCANKGMRYIIYIYSLIPTCTSTRICMIDMSIDVSMYIVSIMMNVIKNRCIHMY